MLYRSSQFICKLVENINISTNQADCSQTSLDKNAQELKFVFIKIENTVFNSVFVLDMVEREATITKSTIP